MLKWIGNTKCAQGITGIPARDLNPAEVARYGGEQALLATGLYEKSVKPTVKKEVIDDGRD